VRPAPARPARETAPCACDRAASGSADPGSDAAARLAQAILRDAIDRGAEAIYLEPIPRGLTLKLRVGGRVREKPRFASRLPKGLGPLLLQRLRTMARLAGSPGLVAVFAVRLNGRPQRFRLEQCPMPHGQGLVIYPVA
jgi:type II secretory ATPase GspE/PulE/Tfp pilus assembly ATPase PilB-like protein